jgi:hypothetical protein
MSLLLAADPIVDWAALLKVIWVSAAGGLGLMAAFSLAVLGAVRASEHRRADSPVGALLFTLLAVICVAICVAAIWQGYLFVVNKE